MAATLFMKKPAKISAERKVEGGGGRVWRSDLNKGNSSLVSVIVSLVMVI